ncbi:hypothetical protein NKI13_18380 [Mesorhizobium australicum]|uniref:hypothetical protein n=1 Tax=Mesorhizobium australicum TaxID=536018 RepID=UPI0033365AF9
MKAAIVFQLTLIVAFIYGWVVNLIAVIHALTHDAPMTTLLVGRIIGVPVGIIGAVLGWF